ncbi:MAG TPA: hypothetical protein EYP06_05455 [Desulfobacterales bacterium]|nr:hypothetical protein [Desulfobacterales bacterium]
MGEIKSTLEIIMEKSKNLRLTEEERERIQKEEVIKRLKGAVQKYLDGFNDLEELRRVVEDENPKRRQWAKEALCEKAQERITLSGNNGRILGALGLIAPDISKVDELVSDLKREVSEQKETYIFELQKELEEMGIRGSAVMPNLEAYQKWINYFKGIEERFKVELQSILKEILERNSPL